MVELSKRTRAHVQALFQSSEFELAERTLISDCGDGLPAFERADANALERVRFAALRVSGGRLDELAKAVQLAQTDWRDLLVSADFADDPQAHAQWLPRRFDAGVGQRWLAGESLPGVAYYLNQRVFVQAAPEPQQPGSVVRLEGLEPQPRYLVQLDSGKTVEFFQWRLARTE